MRDNFSSKDNFRRQLLPGILLYSPVHTVFLDFSHTGFFLSPFKVWPKELGLHVCGGAAEAGVQEGHR